jgi:hypothetical protein
LRSYLRIDLPWGSAQPRAWRFIVAMLAAVVASIVACWVIATVTAALVPATTGYEHFRFADYARLTVIGVVLASVAWPIVTLVSSRARRLYLLLAIIVTVASFAPDAWILHQGQPAAGVVGLMVMHVALLLITYPTLVWGAPQPRLGARLAHGDPVRTGVSR